MVYVFSAFIQALLFFLQIISYICCMKRCSKCKIEKPLSEFYKKRQSKNGHDYWCKACYRTVRPVFARVNSFSVKSSHFSASNIQWLMTNARKRANIKSLDFTITTNLISRLVHEFCESHIYSWDSYHPFKPSIDRIDHTKGYTPDNIQIIWNIENHCKNIYTNADVIQFCKEKLKTQQA